jgi:hypothetical protein
MPHNATPALVSTAARRAYAADVTQEHPDNTPSPTAPEEPDDDLAALEREESELAELERDLEGIDQDPRTGPGSGPNG